MRRPARPHTTSAAAALAIVLLAVAIGCGRARSPDLVIGEPAPPATVAPPLPEPPPPTDDGPGVAVGTDVDGRLGARGDVPLGTRREPRSVPGLARPDGQPWRPPIAFRTDEAVPTGLAFILVVGSDARPGEDLRRTRADSIHLLAINPATRQGTLVGFPRDSYVDVPGRGKQKLNNALALGGPDLLAETVRRVTRLPVDFYVITGFTGLERMVDDLGGVDVHVTRRMADRVSGALFEPGWHRFSGAEALAFSRNRNDVAAGDFSRSEHQGLVMLAALAKMRAEVADDAGVARWSSVLLRHAQLDLPPSRLPRLGALARRLDPARLDNVVVPGRVGMAGSASVVYLTEGANRLFDDLRPDGVIGQASSAPEPTSPSGEGGSDDGRSGPGSATTTSTVPPATSTSTSSTTSTTALPPLPPPP